MATRTIPANPIKAGHAVLTPDLFLALDKKARQMAKRSICVQSPAQLRGDSTRQLWGSLGVMADSLCVDLALLADPKTLRNKYTEMSLIYLTTSVRIADFRAARRPEIDWSVVPDERILEFVAMHEVGHACDNFDHMAQLFQEELRGDKEIARALHCCNEVLADRFAWNAMFPGRPMPIGPERTVNAEQIEAWMRLLENSGVKRGHRFSHRQRYPLEPTTFVPLDHLKKSIPWRSLDRELMSGDARAYFGALRRARVDERADQRRYWKKLSSEMVEAWQEFGRSPSKRGLDNIRTGFTPARRRLMQQIVARDRRSAERQARAKAAAANLRIAASGGAHAPQ